jgi:hypothetical protein
MGVAMLKPNRSGIFVASIATVALIGVAPADEPNAKWYSILTEGDLLVGHASHEVVQTADGTEIVDTQEIDVQDEGAAPTLPSPSPVDRAVNLSWRTVLTEDRSGRTVSIDSVSKVGRTEQHSIARIVDGAADIIRQTSAETRTVHVALPPGVRFDSGDGLLPSWNPVVTPRLEFQDFDIDAMAVERVTIERVAGAAPDAQGRIAVLRKRYEGSELRAITRLLLDAGGNIVEVYQPMFGSSLTIRLTDRNTALYSHFALRALKNAMTKSPFRISQSAIEGHIRYRFSFRDGVEFALPQTGEQRVTVEPGIATVDICEDCGPGLSGDEADLAGALKATAWLQSDDKRITDIADPIAKLPVSDTRKMELLLQKAKPYLGRVDFTGHYSALETMSRHAADCTDAAVLLAALGRAAHIPTRVASGLVYSKPSYHGVSNVFLPHTWTLAFVDGKWKSFDLALDDFDATHIALTIGDGDERSVLAAGQLAGLLHWDNMAEVRMQAAN